MQKEVISKRQAISILIMFVFGSSVVMGVSSEAAQDAWASLLLAALFVVPLLLMYARVIRLCPDQDLFEIIDALFGKIVGKIFIALLCWYALTFARLCCATSRSSSKSSQCRNAAAPADDPHAACHRVCCQKRN